MKKRTLFQLLVGIITTLILVVGLRVFSPVLTAQTNNNLLVSAAASLRESLESIQTNYRQARPNINLRYNFGASGALQQQIENGAPADVFISAAQRQMDALQSKGLILPGTRRNLLTNRLVLIVPRNGTRITSFRQLTSSNIRRIAIGEPRSVPAGQYAQEVLGNLGILNQVRPKFVLGNNVRQVLAAVESGNVDAGIVYATDALTSQQVRQVATAPENLHAPIVYPVAVLKSSRNITAARDYVQFLASDRARNIFRRYRFDIAQ